MTWAWLENLLAWFRAIRSAKAGAELPAGKRAETETESAAADIAAEMRKPQ